MFKKRFPVLEFDSDTNAFINPNMFKNIKLPERLVICFFKEVIADLIAKGKIKFFTEFHSEMMTLNYYKFVDADCGIVQGAIGCPACGAFFEEFIALGVNKVMFRGGAGSLKSQVTMGKYVVINSAVRDEGFSYQYIKPSREISADKEVISQITDYLQKNNIDYVVGKTWTTDAFYRETPKRIALRKKENCLIVEMEQAGMLAVAKFRNVKYGALIYGGDDLTKEEWDSRDWQKQTAVRERLATVCKNIVLTLK